MYPGFPGDALESRPNTGCEEESCQMYDHRGRTSFVFVDTTYIHDGRHRAWEDWDFYDRPPPVPGIPTNWLEPVNYVDGRFHLRVEVLEMEMNPTRLPVGYGIGYCNLEDDSDELHNHTQPRRLRFSQPGVYEASARIRDMWYGIDAGTLGFEGAMSRGWDWTDSGHWLYSFIIPYGQDPFPVKLRVTWTIIATQVEALTIDPPGGRFDWPVRVMVNTPTPMPQIYYTTDGSAPTSNSALYEKPLVLERTMTLKAQAFKNGFDPSDVVIAEFVRQDRD